MISWEEVQKMYPDIDDVLDEIHDCEITLLDSIQKLEDNYPVEGYAWDCDPNSMGLHNNRWFLRPLKWWDDIQAKIDANLAKQKVCVKGEHHFQRIGHVDWCKYCGTVKMGKFYFFPEVPHFLPKEDNNS